MNSKGEIYIADTYSQTIRKVDACGIISHVAGTQWISGYDGDTGPATAAKLNVPMGVAVDADDNLYIADTFNNAIRRVDAATGNITTVAGGVSGDSTLYDGDLAVNAKLKEPNSLAFDAVGNYFIADSKNNVVLRVDAMTGILTVHAGQKKKRKTTNGGEDVPATDAFFDYPWGVAVGPDNNVFITDTTYGTIRRVDAEAVDVEPIINTVAGVDGFNGYSLDGIDATLALLNYPCGVCVTDDNDLIIADTNNSRIRRVDGATGIIQTIAGTFLSGFSGDGGSGKSARLNLPNEVNLGVPSLERVPELCR